MAKKKKKNIFDINKEIIIKTSLKQQLIVDLVSSLFVMVILYLCLTDFNELIISILNIVRDNDYSAIKLVILILPILLIIRFMITFGKYAIKNK